MELWIRSQDKMLLEKVDGITLDRKGVEIYSTSTGRIFGIYKTKERALEVLDEIQKLDIANNLNIEVSCYAYSLIKVTYNMPKE